MVEEETHDMRLSLNLQKHTLASIHYRRGRLHKDFCFAGWNQSLVSPLYPQRIPLLSFHDPVRVP